MRLCRRSAAWSSRTNKSCTNIKKYRSTSCCTSSSWRLLLILISTSGRQCSCAWTKILIHLFQGMKTYSCSSIAWKIPTMKLKSRRSKFLGDWLHTTRSRYCLTWEIWLSLWFLSWSTATSTRKERRQPNWSNTLSNIIVTCPSHMLNPFSIVCSSG